MITGIYENAANEQVSIERNKLVRRSGRAQIRRGDGVELTSF
jgi:hypothetical protein